MQSLSFRFVSTAISTLLMVAFIGVILIAVRDNPVIALPQTGIDTPTVGTSSESSDTAGFITDATPVAPVILEPIVRFESGNFAFQPVADYELSFATDSVTMSAGENSPAAGSVAVLTSGPTTQFVTGTVTSLEDAFIQFVDFYAAQDNFQSSDSRAITVDGAEGLLVDLVSQNTASDFAGRIVMAQPQENRLFVMIGVAPAPEWRNQGLADYMGTLDTVVWLESIALHSTSTSVDEAATPSSPSSPHAEETSEAPRRVTPTPVETPDNTAEQEGIAEPEPTATATARTTPADTEITEISTPLPPVTGSWEIESNGNFVTGMANQPGTIWGATGGGVVAWNKESGSFVKFTTLDGLASNETVAAENCSLPGLGVLFASDQGLIVFDTESGSWKTLSSANSPMSFDDIAALYCDEENGYLIVAYARHGLDTFDAASGEWSYVGQEEGLEFDTIGNAIIRDITVVGDREEIWLASQLGVATFADGATTLYDADNSPLVDNQISAIAGDGGETIWPATGNNLYRTDGSQWDTYDQETVIASDFPVGRITGLAIAADATVWIGTDQNQICHFDPATEQCITFFAEEDGMAKSPLTGLAVDAEGTVYYTTAGAGISTYDGERWTQLEIVDEPIPGNIIRSLARDEDGYIWVTTNGGGARLDPASPAESELFTPANSGLPWADVQAVVSDENGGVWFGGNGASYFDGDTWTNYTQADGVAGPVVQALASDNQGRTWLGTQTGLSIWTGNTFFNLTTENGLPSDDITVLAVDDDIIWIGTAGGGLLRFQDNQLQVFNSANMNLPSDTITALDIYNDGSLLIGTERGMARFADNTITPIEDVASTAIQAIAADTSGEIWAATSAGDLLYFDGTDWRDIDTLGRLPSSEIAALEIDSTGSLWIGSSHGGIARLTLE